MWFFLNYDGILGAPICLAFLVFTLYFSIITKQQIYDESYPPEKSDAHLSIQEG